MKSFTTVSIIFILPVSILSQSETWTFDDLIGWSGDTAHASIVAAPAGMDGSALLMTASDADPMTWMTWGTTLGEFTEPQVSFQFQVADTEAAQPTELYIRFAGWNDYVGILEVDEVTDAFAIELRTSGATEGVISAPVTFDTPHSLVLNFLPGDEISVVLDGTMLSTISSQPWNADTSFGDLSIRSQQASAYLDNLVIRSVPEMSMFSTVLGLAIIALLALRRIC